MLCLHDCLSLSDLTEEEILAIAEHEHIPEIAALEFGNFLLHTPTGEARIREMIEDDIVEARRRGDRVHVRALKSVLDRFVSCHAGSGQ